MGELNDAYAITIIVFGLIIGLLLIPPAFRTDDEEAATPCEPGAGVVRQLEWEEAPHFHLHEDTADSGRRAAEGYGLRPAIGQES